MVESPTLEENLKRLESFRETIKTEEGTLNPLPEIVLDRARRLINNIPDEQQPTLFPSYVDNLALEFFNEDDFLKIIIREDQYCLYLLFCDNDRLHRYENVSESEVREEIDKFLGGFYAKKH